MLWGRHAAGAVILVWIAMLLGAADAAAVPSVTFKCTPAPQNCSGWFRSDVAIEWTVIPSDAAKTGCQNQTFTTDTPSTDVFCRADDGSAAVTVEFKVRVDKTPPVVTGGQPARGADANGWYNHAVPVTFAGSDLTSGIEACTATTYGGPDSATANVQGTCIDRAGNVSAPLGYGLRYDEAAPAVTDARPERPANGNGWFNRAVRFDIEGSDTTSGIAGCTPVTYGGPDSAAASVTGTCQDLAGNSASRPFALKYDAAPPAVTGGQAARATDAGGWYNHAVPVAFTGADQLSGVDACTATTYSGPDGAAASVPGMCTDRAGNVSPAASFALRYDATKPIVTGGDPARGADADGWYNRAVSVAFRGNDQTAGIDGCSTATYAGPDNGVASLAGTCTDHAGNVSAPFAYGLKYDATGPTVTGANPERTANADGWFNRAVAFAIRGTDATSGVADCPATAYAGPDSATASVTGVCRDRAGNSSSRAFPLKYDATRPTVTSAQAARGADVDGWYNRPVSVAFSGADQLSGVDTCTTPTYAGPDSATASAPGTCTDKAGNVSAPLGYALKYDGTGPTVTGGQPARPADANGWYNRAVGISFAGTDPVSGVNACTSTTYGGPDSAASSVAGTCTDKAGNTSSPLALRPQVRRDRSHGHRRRSGAPGERQRLVQQCRVLHDPRHRRHLGRGPMPCHRIQRAGRRDSVRHRGVLGQGRERIEPQVLAQVRRHTADGDARPGGARARCRWLVQPAGRDRVHWRRPGVRRGSLHHDHILRTGPRRRLSARGLHRQGRQRERRARTRAQVRRDPAAGHGR